jgi:hypothetical protein
VQGLAAEERQALAGDMGRPGEHHRPRGTGGTQPGRVLSVRNVVTPSGSGSSGPVSRPQGGPNSPAGIG